MFVADSFGAPESVIPSKNFSATPLSMSFCHDNPPGARCHYCPDRRFLTVQYNANGKNTNNVAFVGRTG